MVARGVIECDGKFLLVRNLASPTFWCLPGGKIEDGEDVVTAMERELVEETGIHPEIGNLLYVHQIQNDNGYGMPEFFFFVKNGQDYLRVDIEKTSHGTLELAELGFKDVATVKLLPKFLKTELPKLATSSFDIPTRFRLSLLPS
jgi:8-oxo-dGTP pyrophosphatase MutT (NUDIX family)